MSDQDGAAAWNQKRKTPNLGGKSAEERRIHLKIDEKEREIQEELLVCRRQARKTERYRHLSADMRKLKDELEALDKSKKPYDPMSLKDGEQATRKAVLNPRHFQDI